MCMNREPIGPSKCALEAFLLHIASLGIWLEEVQALLSAHGRPCPAVPAHKVIPLLSAVRTHMTGSMMTPSAGRVVLLTPWSRNCRMFAPPSCDGVTSGASVVGAPCSAPRSHSKTVSHT